MFHLKTDKSSTQVEIHNIEWLVMSTLQDLLESCLSSESRDPYTLKKSD